MNSLKARLPRVQEWISESQPDVLLIQETKLAQDKFPHAEMAELGYESAHFGQGQWNGVAIISRVGLDNVVQNFAPGIEPDGEARIITATCGGIQVSSVYVPNGRSLDHDHYQYKLSWLSRLRAHLDASCKQTDDVVVGGSVRPSRQRGRCRTARSTVDSERLNRRHPPAIPERCHSNDGTGVGRAVATLPACRGSRVAPRGRHRGFFV